MNEIKLKLEPGGKAPLRVALERRLSILETSFTLPAVIQKKFAPKPASGKMQLTTQDVKHIREFSE
jgi:hypothetical protein